MDRHLVGHRARLDQPLDERAAGRDDADLMAARDQALGQVEDPALHAADIQSWKHLEDMHGRSGGNPLQEGGDGATG